MRCLSIAASSIAASIASWPLRSALRSPERNRFFASCWVSVDPPETTLPRRRFLSIARPFLFERRLRVLLSQRLQARVHEPRRRRVVLDPIQDLRKEPELVDRQTGDRRPDGIAEQLPQ